VLSPVAARVGLEVERAEFVVADDDVGVACLGLRFCVGQVIELALEEQLVLADPPLLTPPAMFVNWVLGDVRTAFSKGT
jgi:hypothetical protein